jgi:hypothetical protein
MLSANDWAMKVSIVLRHIGAGVTVRICNGVLRFSRLLHTVYQQNFRICVILGSVKNFTVGPKLPTTARSVELAGTEVRRCFV